MNLRTSIARRPWLLSVVIAVSVLAWMLSGGYSADATIAADGADTPEARNAPREVQVVTQRAERVTRNVELYGRTAPARGVRLKAETQGRVVEIVADRGTRVEAGEVIMRLDMRDREARLAEARSVLRQRELEFTGRDRLKPEGYVSETLLAEAAANLERARAEVKRAELDLEFRNVRAPFAGVVEERLVELGDFVQPADPLLDFVDTGRIIVTAAVAEQDVAAVRRQSQGTARLVTGEEISGRIRYLSPVADEATRTFTVELEIDNPDGDLAAGVTAALVIPTDEVLAQKVSPALLTLDEEGTLGIKIVDESDSVVFVPADVARSGNDGVWLTGLPEEATIITVGQGFVQSGEYVVKVPKPADAESITAGAPQ